MAGQAAMNIYNPVATNSLRQTQPYYTYQIYSTVKLWNLCACNKLPYYLTPSIWSLIPTHSDKQICTWRGVKQWVTPALSHYGRISVICLCSKEVKEYSFMIKYWVILSTLPYRMATNRQCCWSKVWNCLSECLSVWVSEWVYSVCCWVNEWELSVYNWVNELELSGHNWVNV